MRDNIFLLGSLLCLSLIWSPPLTSSHETLSRALQVYYPPPFIQRSYQPTQRLYLTLHETQDDSSID